MFDVYSIHLKNNLLFMRWSY